MESSPKSASPAVAGTWLLGGLLWALAAFGTGYLVGAQRQFSQLPVYHLGQEIAFDSKAVTFVGWSPAEAGWRWSDGPSTAMHFRPADPGTGPDLHLELLLQRTSGNQPVTVRLNGQPVGAFQTTGGPARLQFAVPRALIKPLADNELELLHPKAERASPSDSRRLAVALASWRLAP